MGFCDSVQNFCHQYLCFLCAKNPKTAITYAWVLSLVIVVVAFICACAAAAYIDSEQADKSVGFAAVWTSLTSLALSVGGTIIMRRYQTSIAIGFLLGLVSFMSQQCLIICAIFGGRAEEAGDNDDSDVQADQALSFFAFVLFVTYAVFAIMLAIFREDLIKDDTTAEESNYQGDDTYNQSNSTPGGV